MRQAVVGVVGFPALPDLQNHEMVQTAVLLEDFEARRAGIFQALHLKIVHQLDRVGDALLSTDDIDVRDDVNGASRWRSRGLLGPN